MFAIGLLLAGAFVLSSRTVTRLRLPDSVVAAGIAASVMAGLLAVGHAG